MRKAVALMELTKEPESTFKAIESFNNALLIARENEAEYKEIIEEMEKTVVFALKEVELDTALPMDHPERARYNTMLEWMEHGGSKFDKLKLRYYTDDYRGVHAARPIKKDETILFVPFHQLLTLDMAMMSPIGS